MLWGAQEFLDVVHSLAFRRGWPGRPPDRVLLTCRAEALRLNDDSGRSSIELAALFFALSTDERRTRPVPHALPVMVVYQFLLDHRIELVTERGELGWMRHAIAEGSTDWSTVRAWFVERCRRTR